MWTRLSLLWLGCTAYAKVSRQCEGDVCYGLNIPEQTASSGAGHVYLQITGPTNYSWIGLGQGSSMTGSRLFVLYTSADGTNVTISPRLGPGHNLPRYDNTTGVTLLEGSGVKDGIMTGNVRCTNCQSWSGGSGSMDFSTSSAQWIYARASGNPLNSDDPDQGIPYHGQSYGSFEWQFAAAKGGNSANPFTAAATDPGTAEQLDGSNDAARKSRILRAHAVLACLAFVIFFPSGAISLRVLRLRGLVWIHAGIQGFAFVLYVVAFGMGIYLTKDEYSSETHPTLGKVVLVMLVVQTVLGQLHHRFFKKHQRRGYWSHGHLWLGRAVIALGIVNGGLGLELAGEDNGTYIAYGVVSGIVWLVYAAVAVRGEIKRKGVPVGAQDQQELEDKPRTEATGSPAREEA